MKFGFTVWVNTLVQIFLVALSVYGQSLHDLGQVFKKQGDLLARVQRQLGAKDQADLRVRQVLGAGPVYWGRGSYQQLLIAGT